MNKKKSKDSLLVDILLKRGLADSRLRAESMISSGEVYVNGEAISSINAALKDENLLIEILPKRFVSRAGYKLKKALDEFKINLKDKICIDAGSSTGGFTDCMLQYGAKKIFAVDSAYNELDWKLRNDNRVEVHERTRISDLVLAEKVDFISVDLSLISIKKVLKDIISHLKPSGEMVILIKPQYEIETNKLPQGGIITDSKTHEEILNDLQNFFESLNLEVLGITTSPIRGMYGNVEFLSYMKK